MSGTVYLVGAGPGDHKLLTIRALELLQSADVVLYDRLVSKKIIGLIPKKTTKLYVGREVGDDYKHQDDTNLQMVKFAKSKKNVVRLKGGDPFIFGRGGEEAEYLKKYKIKYQIIPGITSGIGSAVYSGIPLTHRKYSSSVVFVTGHEDPGKIKSPVNWKKLAKSVETIVIMMGLSRIGNISKQLIEGGLSKKTPVAVIYKGTNEDQKLLIGNLSNIEFKIKQNKFTPPSVIIIGNVVKLHKTIGWK
ncbi:MAG: uroporphyrinogen-III C-methyltransferase [Candidatus Nitrosotenuis sp.]